MSKYCVVCKNSKDSALIKFPTDVALREIWMQNTNVSLETALSEKSRLCLLHFDDNQWEDRLSKTKRPFRALIKDAIPTLYVGENAPVADNIPIPRPKRTKNIRCAVCNIQVMVSQAVAVYEKNDSYTDFGATLAFILKLTSRPLASRFCCVDCSEEVFACFGSIVNINVSSILTSRMNAKHEADTAKLLALYQEKKASGDETPVMIKIGMKTMRDVKATGLLDSEEECSAGVCEIPILTLHDFTEHLTNHFFERKDGLCRAVAITQTDEMEIDMAATINDDCAFAPIIIPRKRKARNKDNFDRVKQEIKEEVEEPDEVMGEDDMLSINLRDDSEFIEERLDEDFLLDEETLIEEHLTEEYLSGEDVVEERLLSETEVDDNENKPEEGSGDELEFKPKRKYVRSATGGMCHVCGRTLKNATSLKMHMKMHTDQSYRKNSSNTDARDCEYCGVTLKHMMSYKQHMLRVHSSSNNHGKVCDICGQVRGNLTQHRKTCRLSMAKGKKTSSSTCGVCGKIFASRYMSKHLKLHTMEEDIARNGLSAVEKYIQTCEICGQKTRNLSLHNIKKHNLHEGGLGDLDPDTSVHDCKKCGAKFEQRPLLVAHLILKHGLDPKTLPKRGRQGIRANWKCSVCGQTFHTYFKIKRHTQAEHNGVGINLACEQCGKRYNTIEALREHINVKHIQYYQFNCFPCDKHFVNIETYEKHIAYYCRMNGMARRRNRRIEDEDSQPFEAKFEVPEYEVQGDDLPLVDINGDVTEVLEESDDHPGTVYLPQESMVVVYEESVPFRS